MTQNEKTVAAFESRVRQLILRFQELKRENRELRALVDKNELDIKRMHDKLNQAANDYNSLKMAKMMEITDGDLQGAKDRVSKLIRDVNKCIAILSNEQ